MKTLLPFLILLFTIQLCLAGPVVPDYALEGYPETANIINGRYKYYTMNGSGYREFRATRSYGTVSSPQVIKFNMTLRRWEISATVLISGVSRVIVVATNTGTGIYPPPSSWSAYNFSGLLLPSVTLKVYETLVQTSRTTGRWSQPTTWWTGIVPRAYDDVVIYSRVTLDAPAVCNDLKLKSKSLGAIPDDRSDFGIIGNYDERARLKVHGNVRVEQYCAIEIYSIEFAGSALQDLLRLSTFRSHDFRRVIINNPKGVRVTDFWFRSFGLTSSFPPGHCETRLVLGKLFVGPYGQAVCDYVTGPNADRFIVLQDKTSSLKLRANAGSAVNVLFPVGSVESSYTPVRVLHDALPSWTDIVVGVENSGISFPSTPHVNVIYRVRAGTSDPSVAGWRMQAYWYPSDESTGFNHSGYVYGQQVTFYKDAWIPLGSRIGSPGIPAGSGPYNFIISPFTLVSGSDKNFAIFQSTSKTRIGLEEAVSDNISEDNIEFGAFPNPATKAGFKLKVGDANDTKIKLTGISGNDLKISLQKESANIIFVKPAEELTPGIYILNVQDKNSVRSHKVVIN